MLTFDVVVSFFSYDVSYFFGCSAFAGIIFSPTVNNDVGHFLPCTLPSLVVLKCHLSCRNVIEIGEGIIVV